jgi:hypothetical protein
MDSSLRLGLSATIRLPSQQPNWRTGAELAALRLVAAHADWLAEARRKLA